jgi:hypothetical protein
MRNCITAASDGRATCPNCAPHPGDLNCLARVVQPLAGIPRFLEIPDDPKQGLGQDRTIGFYCALIQKPEDDPPDQFLLLEEVVEARTATAGHA